MKINNGNFTLRVLSVVPAIIGLIVLGFAVLFAITAICQSFWILLALSIGLGVCSAIIFHCSYAAWRQPSPLTVRDVCQWTGFALFGIGILTFSHFNTSGPKWLAWVVLIASLLATSLIETWLPLFISRKVFGANGLRAA